MTTQKPKSVAELIAGALDEFSEVKGDLYYFEAGDGQAYAYGGCEHYEAGFTAENVKKLHREHGEMLAALRDANQIIRGYFEDERDEQGKWRPYSFNWLNRFAALTSGKDGDE